MRTFPSQEDAARYSACGENAMSVMPSSGGSLTCTSFLRSPVVGVVELVVPNSPAMAARQEVVWEMGENED